MANHIDIAEAAELDIYFCDPRSPWQRGTNENTNGLLRQHFAKAPASPAVFPADYLDYVAIKLNRRPRKALDFKTPAEALTNYSQTRQNHQLLHPPRESAGPRSAIPCLLATGLAGLYG
jgi:IS30 family transposase